MVISGALDRKKRTPINDATKARLISSVFFFFRLLIKVYIIFCNESVKE